MRTQAIAASNVPRESPSRDMLGRHVRAPAVIPAFCVATTRLSTRSVHPRTRCSRVLDASRIIRSRAPKIESPAGNSRRGLRTIAHRPDGSPVLLPSGSIARLELSPTRGMRGCRVEFGQRQVVVVDGDAAQIETEVVDADPPGQDRISRV